MPMSKEDRAFLWDILSASCEIHEFTQEMDVHGYLSSRRTQLAVERLFEIIGEVSRNLSEEARSQYSVIPWRKIIGLRNLIAHDYGDINHERLWVVIRENVPDLIAEIKDVE